jgi:hypothetical protein
LAIDFDLQNYYNFLVILDFSMNHPIDFYPEVIDFQMKNYPRKKKLLKIFIMTLFFLVGLFQIYETL